MLACNDKHDTEGNPSIRYRMPAWKKVPHAFLCYGSIRVKCRPEGTTGGAPSSFTNSSQNQIYVIIVILSYENCWPSRILLSLFAVVDSIDRRFIRKPMGRPRVGNKFHKAESKPWANHRQMSGANGGTSSIGFQPAIGRPWEPDSLRGKWSRRNSGLNWWLLDGELFS